VDVACDAITAQATTVLPDPGGATRTPSSWNPAEFRQMHDLMRRDLRACEDDVLWQTLRM
jgi:hypothetical protein